MGLDCHVLIATSGMFWWGQNRMYSQSLWCHYFKTVVCCDSRASFLSFMVRLTASPENADNIFYCQTQCGLLWSKFTKDKDESQIQHEIRTWRKWII